MKDSDEDDKDMLKEAGIQFLNYKSKIGHYIRINSIKVSQYLQNIIIREKEIERQNKMYPEHLRLPPPSHEQGLILFLTFILSRVFHESKRSQWSQYFVTTHSKPPVFEIKYTDLKVSSYTINMWFSSSSKLLVANVVVDHCIYIWSYYY